MNYKNTVSKPLISANFYRKMQIGFVNN